MREAIARDVLPLKDREHFDSLVDLVGRRFGTDVFSLGIARLLPDDQFESDLLWSAMDSFRPSEKEKASKSGQTKENKTRDKILFGFALASGYRSGSSDAIGKIMPKLERVGV